MSAATAESCWSWGCGEQRDAQVSLAFAFAHEKGIRSDLLPSRRPTSEASIRRSTTRKYGRPIYSNNHRREKNSLITEWKIPPTFLCVACNIAGHHRLLLQDHITQMKHHEVIVETFKKTHVATSQNPLKIRNHGCNTAQSWLQHGKIMFTIS